MVLDNRRRALADIVTLEAWHKAFGPRASKVNLHVDVVFGTGRIGGEADSPVRFQLQLKQAELVVVIPNNEPAIVDPKTVSRDSTEREVKVTQKDHETTAGRTQGEIELNTGKGVKISGGRVKSVERGQQVTIERVISAMTIVQSRTSAGDYRWTLTPNSSDHLAGRPWDAETQPRLKIEDTRGKKSKSLEPTINVEVRCRREDLLISKIVLKDKTAWEKLKRLSGARNRIVAAEAAIRDRLFREGLFCGDVGDPYAQMTLAVSMSESW